MKLVQTNLEFKKTSGSPFSIETEPEHIKLHTVMLLVGKRGSGKSFMASHLLRWLKYDRIILVSPTYESNQSQFKGLPITDTLDPDDPDVVKKINAIVDGEKDMILEYRRKLEIVKELKANYHGSALDHLFSEYKDTRGNWVEPEHYLKGRKPRIAVFVDDAQSTKIFRNSAFLNLTTRSRHLGSFPGDEGSIGISLFIAVQNYTATGGGLPRAVRGNATHMVLFRTKNSKELDLIADEFAGEVSPETFKKVYNFVMDYDTSDKYVSLFIDLHPKPEHPSGFRKNYVDFVVI